jgi:hypothetical protein
MRQRLNSAVAAGFASISLLLLGGCAAVAGTAGTDQRENPPVPTGTGTALPIDPIRLAIDHEGAYKYTSDPLPISSPPAAIGTEYKIVDGTAELANQRVGVVTDDAGNWVVKATFTVVSFTGRPSLEIEPPTIQEQPSR